MILELGYQPNAIARFMARGHTETLICLAPNLTDYTFASVIGGAETAVRAQGYYLMSSSTPDPATFAALVDELIGGGHAEGLLVINPFVDDRHQHLPAEAPVVLIGGRGDENGVRMKLNFETPSLNSLAYPFYSCP